jgi:hypothetical protein
MHALRLQIGDNKPHATEKGRIVNKVFKTEDEMFAIDSGEKMPMEQKLVNLNPT